MRSGSAAASHLEDHNRVNHHRQLPGRLEFAWPFAAPSHGARRVQIPIHQDDALVDPVENRPAGWDLLDIENRTERDPVVAEATQTGLDLAHHIRGVAFGKVQGLCGGAGRSAIAGPEGQEGKRGHTGLNRADGGPDGSRTSPGRHRAAFPEASATY